MEPPTAKKPVAPLLRLLTPAGGVEAAERREGSVAFDDARILARVRDGDPSAAADLHDRVRPAIDRTIGRLLGRQDPEHDELVQIALTELVLTIDRFRGDCSLDHWATRVTSHAVYNEVRRRQRARRVFAFDVELEERDRADGRDVEADAATREILHRVRRYLDALEPNRAWTLVLHDVAGHDLREIAEITSVSVSAAQSRLVRGRRELRELLMGDPELAEFCSNPGRRR